MSMEKDKRRATRRSREAKALQQKQYRQRIVKNKKKEMIDAERDKETLQGLLHEAIPEEEEMDRQDQDI